MLINLYNHYFFRTGILTANEVFELSQGRSHEARRQQVTPIHQELQPQQQQHQQHANQQTNYLPGGFLHELEQGDNQQPNFAPFAFH